MKIIFFSDVHIRCNSLDGVTLCQRFIDDHCEDADMIIVVGDLFDFYHGYDNYIYSWYRPIADMLKNIVERGKRVYFLEGNHEFNMGKYFEDYTGVTCARELTIDVEGKKVFVAHGDGFSRFSLARFLRSSFVYRIMDTLGPKATWKIAMMVQPFLSRKNKAYSSVVQNIFRSNARKKFSEGYDVVVLAHSHIPDILETDDGTSRKQYLNTGDLAGYASYVEYETASGFSLKTCSPPKREG